MALNAYMRAWGETQGEIKGSVTQAGREGSIMVIATSHEVTSPRDPATGKPSGKRQHHPLTITKEIDRSSPLLMSALCNNENLKEVRIQFWQPSRSGKEKQYYTIQLHNASVSGIHFEMLNNKYPEHMAHKEREHVSFCYQKITWTFTGKGISTSDDWVSPVA